METILIKIKDGKKVINNRSFEEVVKDFSNRDQEYTIIKDIFDSINSQEELILYLKNIRNEPV